LDVNEDNPDWAPPPPREVESPSLQRKAEAIVRLHQVTFGEFLGKRVIYADVTLPKQSYDTLAEAMRKELI
jgi:hypothetical protein